MSYIILQSFNANPMEQAIVEAFACINDEIQVDTIIQLNHNLYSVMYTALTEVKQEDFCFMINAAVKKNSDLAVIEVALPVENEILDRRYEELSRLKRFVT
jgi:uncharacterized protein YjfI (DUF2170 family)